MQRRTRQSGYSLTELVVVCAVLVILAGVAFPIAKNISRRHMESELLYSLRMVRNAIDEYKRYCDAGLIPQEGVGSDCYPDEMERLLEPIDLVGQIDVRKRFLRRVPVDPMTGEVEWGLRSNQDEPDSHFWGGEHVYDVYSLSGGVGLNGVPYKEW